MEFRSLSVSEVNSYIKRTLLNDPILDNLKIKGEVSNFKVHSSGNVYLSLKDEDSKINCVVFKRNFNTSLNIENGTKIIAKGRVNVYERGGSYQFYVEEIVLDGIGDLHIKFNKLKEKLSKEGLFDQNYKKQIPKMPKSIGIITSSTGAVIRDIINVTKRRFPKVKLILYPVAVQGEKSAKQICDAIEFFNEKSEYEILDNNKSEYKKFEYNRPTYVDTIIIARGGGSMEELWSFNEEIVARAIFNSNIPIVSGVGHETDFTICDFVSDLRAPTPSAAAEVCTPSLNEINYKLYNLNKRMNNTINNRISLDTIKLKNLYEKINNYMDVYIIKDKIIQIDYIYDKISRGIENSIKKNKDKLVSLGTSLENLSPIATMTRGYSVVNKNDKVINSVKYIEKEDSINVILSDGSVDCRVEKINENQI